MIRPLTCTIAVFALVAVSCVIFPGVLQAQTENVQHYTVTETTTVTPHFPGEFPLAAPMSAAQHQALQDKEMAVRVRVALQTPSIKIGPVRNSVRELRPSPRVEVQPASAVDSAAAGGVFPPAGGVLLFHNQHYTIVGDGQSAVAEPAAASDGARSFYSANWSRGYSTNGGGTYTAVPDGTGPAFAPSFCCDQDVWQDNAHDTTFWSELFCDPATCTVGIVRIHVRNLVSADNCFYDIDPDPASHSVLPDYPHIRGSIQWLYLSTNEIGGGGTVWNGAHMRRFDLNAMANCAGAATQIFNYTGADTGQRVFSPATGATDTMAFGFQRDASTIRLFQWSDGGAFSSADVAVASTNNGAGTCLGGGVNWLAFFLSTSVHGFEFKSAIARDHGTEYIANYWNGADDGFNGQAYSHAALVRVSDYALLSQPHLFNGSSCISYVNVASNEDGDLGFAMGFGSCKAGSGCGLTFETGAVGVADEFTCYPGNPCNVLFTTATNANTSRYGDYLTVNRGNTCRKAFVATTFAIFNGLPNERFNEFSGGNDYECYRAYSGVPRLYP